MFAVPATGGGKHSRKQDGNAGTERRTNAHGAGNLLRLGKPRSNPGAFRGYPDAYDKEPGALRNQQTLPYFNQAAPFLKDHSTALSIKNSKQW
jgi:hypothetical protein